MGMFDGKYFGRKCFGGGKCATNFKDRCRFLSKCVECNVHPMVVVCCGVTIRSTKIGCLLGLGTIVGADDALL